MVSKLEAIGLIGLLLLLHDAKDFGKLDRLHHWQYGAAMIAKPEWFTDLI